MNLAQKTMTLKTKVKVKTAVSDYQKMFPEEYQDLLKEIARQRENLETEFAEVKGSHSIKRALFTVSETLAVMIAQKLDEEERLTFKDLENQRWFCREFPQFSLTKEV